MDVYKSLASVLASDGIICHFQSAGQMVVSAQVGPTWPNRGNSFWITYVGCCWYIFTWIPIGYKVPTTVEVADLCRTCMNIRESAMHEVPHDVVSKFGLVEITEEEAELIFREMKNDTMD